MNVYKLTFSPNTEHHHTNCYTHQSPSRIYQCVLRKIKKYCSIALVKHRNHNLYNLTDFRPRACSIVSHFLPLTLITPYQIKPIKPMLQTLIHLCLLLLRFQCCSKDEQHSQKQYIYRIQST